MQLHDIYNTVLKNAHLGGGRSGGEPGAGDGIVLPRCYE